MEASEDLRETARKQIKKRRDFRAHVALYLLVNALVWGLWVILGIANGFSFPWPVFVTGGWGIGVLLNAFETFGRPPITEQEVEAEMQRLQRRS